jgi:hypothetical protein
MKLKVVHVTWLDSSAASRWEDPDSESELTITHSAGFLIKETENSIILALSYDPDTQEMNCYKHIPLVAIQRMRTLCTIPTTTKT